ncbi:hypothetical protein VTJ49DRAFT_2101 [Mycothermus thermophilus]|uniref:Uncharacterized protein n=1 Tax=Humicola insolens TaxID=85995 RepID=A0ABR3VBF7_HUMIN
MIRYGKRTGCEVALGGSWSPGNGVHPFTQRRCLPFSPSYIIIGPHAMPTGVTGAATVSVGNSGRGCPPRPGCRVTSPSRRVPSPFVIVLDGATDSTSSVVVFLTGLNCFPVACAQHRELPVFAPERDAKTIFIESAIGLFREIVNIEQLKDGNGDIGIDANYTLFCQQDLAGRADVVTVRSVVSSQAVVAQDQETDQLSLHDGEPGLTLSTDDHDEASQDVVVDDTSVAVVLGSSLSLDQVDVDSGVVIMVLLLLLPVSSARVLEDQDSSTQATQCPSQTGPSRSAPMTPSRSCSTGKERWRCCGGSLQCLSTTKRCRKPVPYPAEARSLSGRLLK